jgi:hypothetical protein
VVLPEVLALAVTNNDADTEAESVSDGESEPVTLMETLGVDVGLAALLADALRLSPSGSEADGASEALGYGEAQALAVSEGRPDSDTEAVLDALAQSLCEALGELDEDRDGREALGGGEALPVTLVLSEAKGEADAEAQAEGRKESLAQPEALGASESSGVPEPLATLLCEDHALALGETLEDADGD